MNSPAARNLIAAAEVRARKAIAQCEMKLAGHAGPARVFPHASAGQLLVALAEKGAPNPLDLIRDARATMTAELKGAEADLHAIREAATWLASAAAYAGSESHHLADAPPLIPPEFVANLQQARHFARSGVIDGSTLKAKMEDAAMRAVSDALKAVEGFHRFYDVGQIASGKGAASLCRQFGLDIHARAFQRRADAAGKAFRERRAVSRVRSRVTHRLPDGTVMGAGTADVLED